MKKTIDYLYRLKQANDEMGNYEAFNLYEAIEELESLQAEYKEIKEYYWFARNHIESYRCKCGALGRVGYLCSNKECKYE